MEKGTNREERGVLSPLDRARRDSFHGGQSQTCVRREGHPAALRTPSFTTIQFTRQISTRDCVIQRTREKKRTNGTRTQTREEKSHSRSRAHTHWHYWFLSRYWFSHVSNAFFINYTAIGGRYDDDDDDDDATTAARFASSATESCFECFQLSGSSASCVVCKIRSRFS